MGMSPEHNDGCRWLLRLKRPGRLRDYPHSVESLYLKRHDVGAVKGVRRVVFTNSVTDAISFACPEAAEEHARKVWMDDMLETKAIEMLIKR